MAHATHIDVFTTHTVEGMLFGFEEAQEWIANQVLNALFVLQPGAITLLTSAPLTGPTRPSSLRNTSLQLLIASVEVMSPNIQFDSERQHIDECQDLWLIIDQLFPFHSVVKVPSNFSDKARLQCIRTTSTEALSQFLFTLDLILRDTSAKL